MNQTVEIVIWILFGIGIPTALAITFFVFPYKIVQVQARLYRMIYYNALGWTEDKIDSAYELPTDHALMGKRSEFIRIGVYNPKHYSELIAVYRFIGGLIGALVTATLVLLLIYFMG